MRMAGEYPPDPSEQTMRERMIRIMDYEWNGRMALRLFDAGANGSDGAQGASSAGEGGEDAAHRAADAGQNTEPSPKGQDLSHMVYGKQPEGERSGEKDAHAGPQQGKGLQTGDGDDKKSFDELIRGDYRKDFEKKTQAIIDRRFRQTRQMEKRLSELEPMLDLLASRYSVDKGDVGSIVKAVEEDNSFYEQEAEELGIPVEQLKKQRRLERENAVLRAERQRAEADEKSREIYNGWIQQAEEVKKTYPDFDFLTECQNEKFLELIRSPAIDVRTAYEVLHRDEIMTGVMKHTAHTVQQKTVEDIKARGLRPSENGMTPQSSAIFKTNVKDLTKEDMAEINRRVARGEKITF